jgi:hypothetical protein
MKIITDAISIRNVLASIVIIAAMWMLIQSRAGMALSLNGFEIVDPLVSAEQIIHGGPPRDGIPAIDSPVFVTAEAAGFLKPDDRILGVYRNGVAKAYAVRILNYHEIVNDTFGDDRVVITFCPLCGTGMAFEAVVAGVDRTFGVSGLLYNSDMLLYDRQSMSLWSQISKKAINGPLKGKQLRHIPTSNTTWADWLQRYPATLVLSTKTGYSRNYNVSPYPGYTISDQIMFPVSATAARYHPKELVVGLEINQHFKAYPFVELAMSGTDRLSDVVGNVKVQVIYDAQNRSARVLDSDGRELPSVISYWFAWIAFHPESEVFVVER